MMQALKRFKCLSGWNPLSCTSSVFRLLPNVKKLQICGIPEDYIRKVKVFHDLCCLDQLMELKFKIRKMLGSAVYIISFALPPPGAFPKNLKKLAFRGTRLHWEDLEILGKLPKLEALKLGYDACIGTDWEVGEEGFPHLKFLRSICTCITGELVVISLERLVINHCWSMYWIPQDFVDITTFQLIHISDCAKSVGNSAKKIQQEIEDNYGSSVEVCISTFPKNLKKLAFTGTRLHWEDLGILGELPKLEALKLGYDACTGTDWEVGEEGFPHLKFL
ncbi:hypothetical protein KY289_012877 [Solanum tuberosum]|nr:hypothetical protein KY289_012877 [Solanum tuberosum]